jgi:hypothetical protein
MECKPNFLLKYGLLVSEADIDRRSSQIQFLHANWNVN